MITTLEELRDFINENEDWNLEVNDIIKANNWVDDTWDDYGICNDGRRKLQFNSDMEAEIVVVDNRERIGAELQSIRTTKGMTQQLLADEADMQRTTISKIESGKFNASIDLLSKICDVLDCQLTITEKDDRTGKRMSVSELYSLMQAQNIDCQLKIMSNYTIDKYKNFKAIEVSNVDFRVMDICRKNGFIIQVEDIISFDGGEKKERLAYHIYPKKIRDYEFE